MFEQIKLNYKIFEIYELQGECYAGTRSRIPMPIRFVWSYMAQHVAAFHRHVTCRLFGHEWVDQSYATPETGNADIMCKRCYLEHHITLY